MRPNPNVQRLARAIEERAAQPGWSYKRVAAEAAVDVVTIGAIRKGEIAKNPQPSTLRGLDRALGYEPGGVAAILAGGEPTLAPVAEVPDPDEQRILEMERLTEDEKRILIGHLRESRRSIVAQGKRLNDERGRSAS